MVFLDAIKSLPPAMAIFLVALFVSFLLTVVYKFTTNQKLMKILHADMKSLRDEIKNSKDTSQATQLNKRLMEKTMQQIMHSMKSTMITIIPVFLIFGWLHTNLAFASTAPGEEFTTTIDFARDATGTVSIFSETLDITDNLTKPVSASVSWKLSGGEGTHIISYTYEEETYTREVIITNDWKYADPYLEKEKTILGLINIGDKNPIKPNSQMRKISVNLPQIHPFGGFTLFGWQPGWLATYFVFTLMLTFPIRKLLRVH